MCVQRSKTVDKLVKDQLKECFVQNVTQCYYTYVTEYEDGQEEKCDEFYWKSCKIVFEQKSFNATLRQCKRPLLKECDDNPQQQPQRSSLNSDNVVCETFFETTCNTTDIIPDPGDEPVAVTFCDKTARKICAPDNCRVVEGPEDCSESTTESLVQHPKELCELAPQKHCTTINVAVPKLLPEKKCRQVEKDICKTQLVNPHEVPKTIFVKYCARAEDVGFPPARPSRRRPNSYLPPPPVQPVYNNGLGQPQTGYGAPFPQQPNYRSNIPGNNALRSKREPTAQNIASQLGITASRRSDKVVQGQEDGSVKTYVKRNLPANDDLVTSASRRVNVWKPAQKF